MTSTQSHQCYQDKAVLWHTSAQGKQPSRLHLANFKSNKLCYCCCPNHERFYTALQGNNFVSFPNQVQKLLSHQDNEMKVHTTNYRCSSVTVHTELFSLAAWQSSNLWTTRDAIYEYLDKCMQILQIFGFHLWKQYRKNQELCSACWMTLQTRDVLLIHL